MLSTLPITRLVAGKLIRKPEFLPQLLHIMFYGGRMNESLPTPNVFRDGPGRELTKCMVELPRVIAPERDRKAIRQLTCALR